MAELVHNGRWLQLLIFVIFMIRKLFYRFILEVKHDTQLKLMFRAI